jgi:hypothetical protein
VVGDGQWLVGLDRWWVTDRVGGAAEVGEVGGVKVDRWSDR